MSAFVRNVLSSGKDGSTSFLLFMLNSNPNNQNQTNNSSLMATLIHDTDRMSSLEIAELTGKRHDAILRDIRNLLKQGVSAHNFVETSYKQPQPRGGYKELPCFELTKKGCLILASGYDAILREKIIDRWESLEMEKRKPQTPQTYIEALEALVASEKEKERLRIESEQQQATIKIQTEEIKQAAPKNRFSFGNLRNCCIFAVLTVRQTLLLRRAAVNCSMVIGHFLCSIFKDIRRLSIRSHYCFVLRSKVCWTVSSVYGNRFSVAYNDLNAYSHGK
ncbi:Rha family transcriptional regulator [Bacteroides fragilis]|jgi:Rha family phage regulatory protein